MQVKLSNGELPVQQFLLKLSDEKKEIAIQLRQIIVSVSPKIIEDIKWGNLTFLINKTKIAFIYTYKQADYMNLGFLQAIQLTDPKKLFEGTGKGMRHIKVRTLKEIPAAQVKKWVKEALALEMKLHNT